MQWSRGQGCPRLCGTRTRDKGTTEAQAFGGLKTPPFRKCPTFYESSRIARGVPFGGVAGAPDLVKCHPDVRQTEAGNGPAKVIVMASGRDPIVMSYKKIMRPQWNPRAVKKRHPQDEVEDDTHRDDQPFHNGMGD